MIHLILFEDNRYLEIETEDEILPDLRQLEEPELVCGFRLDDSIQLFFKDINDEELVITCRILNTSFLDNFKSTLKIDKVIKL